MHNYERLLARRINPYFAEMPLKAVTLSEIKAWRASLDPRTGATNAAAYRLLRSILQAAEEEELIDRLRLLIILAAFVGLREGELLELRRSDLDGATGHINLSRKIDKDVIPGAMGVCPKCGRSISAPKTASGTGTVHVPPPFLPMLQEHLLEHTAAGPDCSSQATASTT